MSKAFDFDQAQNAVSDAAEERWRIDNGSPEDMTQSQRNSLRAFIRVSEREWFKTLQPFASIVVRPRGNGAEIEDRWFGGNITVYRPSREYIYSDERAEGDAKYKVAPGYINASSWHAGDSSASNRTSQSVAQEMSNRLRMMDIAITLLNEYNQVLLDWEDVDNPIDAAPELRKELKQMRENEAARQRAEYEKREARKKK